MGEVCPEHKRAGFHAEYGGCATYHLPDDPRAAERRTYVREDARARRAIQALEAYRRNMSAAICASADGKTETAHWFAGCARAELHLFPQLRAYVDG